MREANIERKRCSFQSTSIRWYVSSVAEKSPFESKYSEKNENEKVHVNQHVYSQSAIFLIVHSSNAQTHAPNVDK